ncbi:hypothetical protein PG993_011671 [Apiospora rasikravindrae]|uniref:BAG domain-containing protein n=1 Tax=Apiospora rasikravindrae TaxID=990691 RepID=A0ABR1S0B7_9PEZI
MCKSYQFQTQCVCKSCGHQTAPSSDIVVFPNDRCDQVPDGTPSEECPSLEPPVVVTRYQGVSTSSPSCRRTVETQLKNATRDLFGSLVVISDLIQQEARAESDEIAAARTRQRFALLNLKEALNDGENGGLSPAKGLLDEVLHDANEIRYRSERLERVRENLSSLLQRMVEDAHEARDRAAAL